MPYKDPVKQKEAQHQHYLDNKEKYRISSKKTRERRREWFYELKSTMSCIRCGENRTPCLEFHHREVRNGYNIRIPVFTNGGWSKKKVLAEIKM